GTRDQARLRLGRLGLDYSLSRGNRRLNRLASVVPPRRRQALERSGARSMSRLFARTRLVVGVLALAWLVAFGAAAQAQQRGPVIDPDAAAVNEQQLLRQAPRIEGRILIPDQRESVLMQPAGRTWDYFHEVILHWAGAIVLVGTVGLLAAFYMFL